eukprot:scaffold29143_cov143-Isochrysis_galbana.AAC.1
MEQTPADARAAPSASEPNDVDMGITSSPKRPRDPAQDNKVSPRATQFDPAMLESQIRTTESWMVRRALRMPYAPYVGSPDPTQCVGPSRTYGRMVRMAYVGVPNYRG